ncbi:hypothetical protein [Ferrimonas sp. YFM]|uniref:hypothetical protein n=1 Tax=Ferrimonas sp. YFM TaxID=3028878 RepID=UPI002572E262|nr:hypothetical protein [Ferrimonas sp. YFM]BDY05544.1 hypothetical protein F0521_25850 [Ferrimonas sp. YFM]
MKRPILAVLLSALISPLALAHPVFADAMKNQLRLYKVECTACHGKDEQYHLRNGLGLRFEAELPKSLTWQYHSVLAMGDPDAIRSQEKAMAKSFSLILLKVGQQPLGDTTLMDQIKAGDLEGIHPSR